jgi:hypothetical protein
MQPIIDTIEKGNAKADCLQELRLVDNATQMHGPQKY